MLPEIINIPFEITLGETKILAKKATLKDLALLQEYKKTIENDTNAVIKEMVYALKLCIEKAYDNVEEKAKITEDFIADLIPLSTISDSSMFQDIMVKLGFMSPTKTVTPVVQETPKASE